MRDRDLFALSVLPAAFGLACFVGAVLLLINFRWWTRILFSFAVLVVVFRWIFILVEVGSGWIIYWPSLRDRAFAVLLDIVPTLSLLLLIRWLGRQADSDV